MQLIDILDDNFPALNICCIDDPTYFFIDYLCGRLGDILGLRYCMTKKDFFLIIVVTQRPELVAPELLARGACLLWG